VRRPAQVWELRLINASGERCVEIEAAKSIFIGVLLQGVDVLEFGPFF
jgi:hypothetical protein